MDLSGSGSVRRNRRIFKVLSGVHNGFRSGREPVPVSERSFVACIGGSCLHRVKGRISSNHSVIHESETVAMLRISSSSKSFGSRPFRRSRAADSANCGENVPGP